MSKNGMIKFKALAVIATGLFAASSLFAADKACCASTTTAANQHDCSATFANLSLKADQKAKMEKLAADCNKGGCNKETMAKMEKSAKNILSKEQFTAWKAACSGKMTEKAQS